MISIKKYFLLRNWGRIVILKSAKVPVILLLGLTIMLGNPELFDLTVAANARLAPFKATASVFKTVSFKNDLRAMLFEPIVPIKSEVPLLTLRTPSFPEPSPVKGIYLTAWLSGSDQFLQKIVEFIRQTEVNTVVIDVKDDLGTLSYTSEVPLAQEIGSVLKKYNPAKVLALMEEHQIYPIARIVVFKDPFLAAKRNDLAVQSKLGGLWSDRKGLHWVDPYNQAVWDYNIAIAKEAIAKGFREIQFDYMRFTSDGAIKNCVYPGDDGRAKADVIRDFLKYASAELKPLGVKISADIFGLVCSADDDMGIGQILEKVAEGADILCPMVYPSHYYSGSYKLANPDASPYETVYQSMLDAKRRLDKLEKPVVMRPWLQDFSLRHKYQREELLAQIKAVEDAGYSEWIFWNPSCKYDLRKYRPKNTVVNQVTPPPQTGTSEKDLQKNI